MIEYENLSCKEFTELLASSAPVPGGGGASALVGALAVALGNMVGSLTLGKARYADVQDDITQLKAQADELQQSLLSLMTSDAEAFRPLSEAYRLPADTDEARAHKAQTMELCLRQACTVPLMIMEESCKAIDLLEVFAIKGTAIALSDVGVGAAFARAALLGASLNVSINTQAMSDKEYSRATNAKADTLIETYLEKADRLYEDIASRLREQ